jgi:hypothetical protein
VTELVEETPGSGGEPGAASGVSPVATSVSSGGEGEQSSSGGGGAEETRHAEAAGSAVSEAERDALAAERASWDEELVPNP